jgi:hypothetical protein
MRAVRQQIGCIQFTPLLTACVMANVHAINKFHAYSKLQLPITAHRRFSLQQHPITSIWTGDISRCNSASLANTRRFAASRTCICRVAAFPPSAEVAPACARLVAPSIVQPVRINGARRLLISAPTTCSNVARPAPISTSAAPPTVCWSIS